MFVRIGVSGITQLILHLSKLVIRGSSWGSGGPIFTGEVRAAGRSDLEAFKHISL